MIQRYILKSPEQATSYESGTLDACLAKLTEMATTLKPLGYIIKPSGLNNTWTVQTPISHYTLTIEPLHSDTPCDFAAFWSAHINCHVRRTLPTGAIQLGKASRLTQNYTGTYSLVISPAVTIYPDKLSILCTDTLILSDTTSHTPYTPDMQSLEIITRETLLKETLSVQSNLLSHLIDTL